MYSFYANSVYCTIVAMSLHVPMVAFHPSYVEINGCEVYEHTPGGRDRNVSSNTAILAREQYAIWKLLNSLLNCRSSRSFLQTF